MAPRVHGRRLAETDVRRQTTHTQAIGRRPGPGRSAAYPNTPEERHAASLTLADRATDRADLDELLAMLGLR